LAEAALDWFAEFSEKWERRCPAIIRLWTDAWSEFVPFLALDVDPEVGVHHQRLQSTPGSAA
jgi:putative transposase